MHRSTEHRSTVRRSRSQWSRGLRSFVVEERQARRVLALAQSAVSPELEQALLAEELQEREIDRRHWEPLRKELEQMRHV